MNFLSLCSGCGGMDLGIERAGFKCAGQVEIMPYALKVLVKHWPEAPKHTDVSTLLRSASLARIYRTQTRKEKALKAKRALSSLSVCGLRDYLILLGCSLKTCPDFFRLMKDGTLHLSSKRFPKAGTGIRGEFWTVNTLESPNDARECSLSDVLESRARPKYYLSKKAVAGMIRRSKRSGKGGCVFLIQSQDVKESGRRPTLRRLSLAEFETIVTGRKISSPTRSEQDEEETLSLYGRTLILRKLTPNEKEALQGLPKDWTLLEEC